MNIEYYFERNVLGHIVAGWDVTRGNPLDCVFIVRNVGKMYYNLYFDLVLKKANKGQASVHVNV